MNRFFYKIGFFNEGGTKVFPSNVTYNYTYTTKNIRTIVWFFFILFILKEGLW